LEAVAIGFTSFGTAFGATSFCALAAGLARGVTAFGGPSLVTGLFIDCALFGGVNGGFSAVFDAEDVVGRIILAKKPSSAGALC
jgi:hypothetical protein